MKRNEWSSTVVGRKAALDPAELPFPPVISALRLLQHPDAIAFPKGQIPRPLTSEVILSCNEQAVGWRWRRRLLLPDYGTGGGGGSRGRGRGGKRSIPVEMISPRGRGCIRRAGRHFHGRLGGFGDARGRSRATWTGRRTRGSGIAEPWGVDRRLRGTMATG
jgi:hypothetical protein